MSEQQTSHRKLVTSLLVIVVGAFGFGYALVPLYDVFCDITGFGGRTNTEAVAVSEAPDLSREIRIEFMTTVNSFAQFEFAADADHELRPLKETVDDVPGIPNSIVADPHPSSFHLDQKSREI